MRNPKKREKISQATAVHFFFFFFERAVNMLTQSHPHIHFSNTFVSQSQKSTFEDDFKMALLKDSRLSLSKEKKKTCIPQGCNCLVDPPPPLNITFEAHFHFNVGFSVNYHPGPHLVSHLHAVTRLPKWRNYTFARLTNSISAAAGGRDVAASSRPFSSFTPSLNAPLSAPPHHVICISVCVCAFGPHRLRHPGL